MGNKKAYVSPIVFLFTIVIACGLCLAVYTLPYIIPPNTSTPTHTGSTQTPIITAPPQVTPPTLTPIPTPFTEIIVWAWQDVRPNCINGKRAWVQITGLEISGGVPPYKFEFKQNEILIYSEVIDLPQNHPFKNEIKFIIPVTVSTGSPVNVKITSTTVDENPSWNKPLLYEWEDITCE